MRTHLAVLSLSLSLAACGGSSEPAPVAPTAANPAPAPAADPHADHHAGMPPEVAAFHDVLRPLWHDETPERQAKTCANLEALDAKAAPLGTAVVPDERKDAYAAAVGQLTASIGELKAACTGNGDFTATFTKVHDGFHAVAEVASGQKHEEHGHDH